MTICHAGAGMSGTMRIDRKGHNALRRLAATAFLLLSVFCLLSAQSVSIARYWGGREAAVSYTFDDGLEDQFTLAFPELKKRGLRATFAIVGSKVGGKMRSSQDRAEGTDGTPVMTWQMIRELSENGQEIGSHGWEHRVVTRLSEAALRHELEANDSAIEVHTGQRPLSFFYPGNAKSDEMVAFCERGRVGSRTFQTSIGSKRDSVWLRRWVDGLMARGEWGVGMTHGIARGYDHFADPNTLWTHWDYVCSLQDSLWIAPFGEVSAYVKERDNVSLTVEQGERRLVVRLSTDLSPQLFRQPLTLQADVPLTARAFQDGRPLAVSRYKDRLLTDVDIHGGEVLIVW